MTLPCGSKPMPCGCCEGTEVLTPMVTANRPGLSKLAYRVGTHATFLETMKARLSNSAFPELRGLTTRDSNDPAIALLDAWATAADVLTFYQERISNEGYLRTATERRSILELARLVGYTLRPGVASSVYLAFTLENNYKVEVPIGARAQSLPGPGEMPQSFETSEKLEARAEWNNLKPRMTRPQKITLNNNHRTIDTDTVYFDGTATNLKPNDPLLFVFGDVPNQQLLRHVKESEVQAADNRTKVTLQEAPMNGHVSIPSIIIDKETTVLGVLGTLIDPLLKPPSLQPANGLRLARSVEQAFDTHRDTAPQLLTVFQPQIAQTAYQAWANAVVTQPLKTEVYTLRVKAAPFGHNLPLPPPPQQPIPVTLAPSADQDPALFLLALDAEYKEITEDSWVVIECRDKAQPIISKVEDVQTVTLGGPQVGNLRFFSTQPSTTTTKIDERTTTTSTSDPIRIRVTLLKLDSPWLNKEDLNQSDSILRRTTIYAQSERLDLTEEPMETEICGGELELGELYGGLQSGRWVIVSGERTDIPGTGGIKASELVMLAGVEQNFDPDLPGALVPFNSKRMG